MVAEGGLFSFWDAFRSCNLEHLDITLALPLQRKSNFMPHTVNILKKMTLCKNRKPQDMLLPLVRDSSPLLTLTFSLVPSHQHGKRKNGNGRIVS